MLSTDDVLLSVLAQLVEGVGERPRRVLFRGVPELTDKFRNHVAARSPAWDVRVTRAREDVVGARNDPGLDTLVVFYRDEVRERESLNAFRQFDEDAIARPSWITFSMGTSWSSTP